MDEKEREEFIKKRREAFIKKRREDLQIKYTNIIASFFSSQKKNKLNESLEEGLKSINFGNTNFDDCLKRFISLDLKMQNEINQNRLIKAAKIRFSEDTYDDYITFCDSNNIISCKQLVGRTNEFLDNFRHLKEDEKFKKFAQKLCYKVYFKKNLIFYTDEVNFQTANQKYNKTDNIGNKIGFNIFKKLFTLFLKVDGNHQSIPNYDLINEEIHDLLLNKIGKNYIFLFYSYFYPTPPSLTEALRNNSQSDTYNIANDYVLSGGTRTAKPKGNRISQHRKSTSRSLTKRYYPKKIRRYTYTNRQKKQKRK